jgi:hypothetical protein
MSEQTVMRYLNGVRDIPMIALGDISAALGLSVQTVVERALQRLGPAASAGLDALPSEATLAAPSDGGPVPVDLPRIPELGKRRQQPPIGIAAFHLGDDS